MNDQRIFAIPDIHGRADLLIALMAKLKAEAALDLKQDKLIFLGDMIDRGPESAVVLLMVRNLQTDHPDNVVVLGGNHEWLCIDGISKGGDHYDLWLWNGARSTMQSYESGQVSEEDVKWMASLPLFHEEPGFFFSHAPIPHDAFRKRGLVGKPYQKQELIWSYDHDEAGFARQHKDARGVCGHIHRLRQGVMAPRFYPHYIFADAGCGCHPYAPLVAINVKTEEIVWAFPEEL